MGRTQQITEQDARNILINKCRQFKTFKILYRGLSDYFDYGLIDPKKSNTIITENNSYYSFLVDWFWKDFPSRAKSVICTPNKSTANNFGREVYIVIPFDNAEFGICPDQDFWNGFKYVFKTVKVNDMLDFDRMLAGLLGVPKSTRPNFFKLLEKITPTMNDKEKLKDTLNKLKGKNLKYTPFVQYIYDSKKDFIASLKDLLDPYANGFTKNRYLSMQTTLFNKDYELWTNDKCLLINQKVFDTFINADSINIKNNDIARRERANDMIAKKRIDSFDKSNIDTYTAARVKQAETFINKDK